MIDCVSRKNVIAWLRMMLMMLLKDIHIETNEDGKSVDHYNWSRETTRFYKMSKDQVASSN
jgi:hypothetical protein